MDIVAVINNYNYDCSWVNKLNFPFEMLSNHSLKQGEATNYCFDIVNYLRYIIQNYNDIHEITWFLHGHENAWHQFGKNIIQLINEVDYSKDYWNISLLRNDYFYGVNDTLSNNSNFHRRIIFELYKKQKYFEPILNLVPGYVITKFNAQFYVKKKLIINKPIEFYKDCLEVICDYKKENPNLTQDCTFVFERLWHFIFTGKLIEEGDLITYLG